MGVMPPPFTKSLFVVIITTLLLVGISGEGFGFMGFGGSLKWKEEVKLNDGRVILLEREMLTEQGGGEWATNRSGTKPKEYRIRFAHPDGSGKMIEWRSAKESPRKHPEFPLILDLESGQPVVFAIVAISAHRCDVYSKYIYRNGVWVEEALPEEFEKRITNLFIRSDTAEMPKYVDLETKRQENASGGYRRALKQVGPTRQVCATHVSAASSCLKYEPEVVELTGKVKRVVFPGQPNYESVKDGDEPEPYYVLYLPKRICVQGDTNDELNSKTEKNVKSLQLIITDYNKYRPLLGKNVTVKGQLIQAQTGHHHTNVLVLVESIEQAPNRQ